MRHGSVCVSNCNVAAMLLCTACILKDPVLQPHMMQRVYMWCSVIVGQAVQLRWS
jgi:hypothetical protein